jgi:hypothetical protein
MAEEQYQAGEHSKRKGNKVTGRGAQQRLRVFSNTFHGQHKQVPNSRSPLSNLIVV